MSYTHCTFTATFDMECPACRVNVPGGTPHECENGKPSSSPAKRKRKKRKPRARREGYIHPWPPGHGPGEN